MGLFGISVIIAAVTVTFLRYKIDQKLYPRNEMKKPKNKSFNYANIFLYNLAAVFMLFATMQEGLKKDGTYVWALMFGRLY
jgi:hypothetical protein